MAWISFVLIAVVLYTPGIGLGGWFLERAPPQEGDALLFGLSLGCWLLLWFLLSLAVPQGTGGKRGALARIGLRDGFMYARRPYAAQAAPVLALLLLAYAGLQWLLAQFQIALPGRFNDRALLLSVFTLVVALAFRHEQRARFQADIQLERENYKRTATGGTYL